MSEIKDKCGIFAAWDLPEAAHLTYLGLFALQHRGQEGAGIVASDGGPFVGHRGEGLVYQVFTKQELDKLPGRFAIGHVRYSTAGGSLAKNVQPLWTTSSRGEIAIAHNGNLTNAAKLRRQLEEEGSVFQTSVDTEVILHLFAKAKGTALERLQFALSKIEGAYSLAVLVREEKELRIFVCKDPQGFRPLVLAKRGNSYMAASETCAFDLLDAEFERELEPGEIVEFSAAGMKRHLPTKAATPAPCIFEWIYFSRPDSVVFGKSVYEMRKKMGAILARQDMKAGFKPDLVVGVPDSGIPAAIGYAQASGVPFEMGLIRNHYIGRTFIQPHQSIRDFSVKIKQNPLKETLEGKSLVVIDDSIVRGTTSKKINQFLREAGVSKIHMRISAPPTVSPCYYGIDTPQKRDLIASTRTLAEVCDFVMADTLHYLSLDSIYAELAPNKNMCDACFSGKYPVHPTDFEAELKRS